jgi:hypothetical protein
LNSNARPDQSIILSYQECKFCNSSDGFVYYDSHGYCYHCSEVWFGTDYDKYREDMNKMHWIFKDNKTRVPNPDKYFGFVYLITNKKNHRKYIGCKQYWQMRHRKKYKPSNWKVYTSSSKELCADIEKIGKRNFKFEIIQEYETKRGLHYYEQFYQMKNHVLTAVLEGTDQKEYYNKNVGGIRFYCPLETFEDPKYKKLKSEQSKAQWADTDYKKSRCKGPYKITFDTGKEIVVDSLIGWGKDNNYYGNNLIQLVNKKPMKIIKGKKYYRKRVKDIVKVERVGEQTSDMGQ